MTGSIIYSFVTFRGSMVRMVAAPGADPPPVWRRGPRSPRCCFVAPLAAPARVVAFSTGDRPPFVSHLDPSHCGFERFKSEAAALRYLLGGVRP